MTTALSRLCQVVRLMATIALSVASGIAVALTTRNVDDAWSEVLAFFMIFATPMIVAWLLFRTLPSFCRITGPRLRLRYTLQTVFVFMLIASIPLALFGAKLRSSRAKQDAVNAIALLDGKLYYESDFMPNGDLSYRTRVPDLGFWKWLCGDNCFGEVVHVELYGGGLESIAPLDSLHRLDVCYPLTDADLVHLAKLRELPELRVLHLTKDTSAGDALAERIGGLTQLTTLTIDDAHLTSTGLQRLRQVLPNCYVEKCEWSH